MPPLRRRTTTESLEPTSGWGDWPGVLFRPWAGVFRGTRWMRVEEFTEDGTLVVRADLPGIDPERDIQISLSDRFLTIEAERRSEEKMEKRHYMCSELRYGSFSRIVTVPEGTKESDIRATYRGGVLEVRVPFPKTKPAIKIPVTTGAAPAAANVAKDELGG